MIAKHKKRIVITLPKELDEFLNETVKILNEKDNSNTWTKSKLIERTLLIHMALAEEPAQKTEKHKGGI